MEKRLCGVCGRALGYWISFVVGPITIRIRETFMPAAHPECAEASLRLCPYLYLEERDRSLKPSDNHIVPPSELPPKPDRVALWLTRSYEIVRQNGSEYARFAAAKRMQWFVYEHGVLVPEARP